MLLVKVDVSVVLKDWAFWISYIVGARIWFARRFCCVANIIVVIASSWLHVMRYAISLVEHSVCRDQYKCVFSSHCCSVLWVSD